MTMQRPVTSGVSNNRVDCGTPRSTQPTALSYAATDNSQSDSANAPTTALGLLTNSNSGNSSNEPGMPTTSLSRENHLESSLHSSGGLWGRSSNLSSVPLLSPSELAGAAEGKSINSSSNDPIQALLLAQMRQRLQQEKAQHLKPESALPAAKRTRLFLDGSESSSIGLDSVASLWTGGSSGAPMASELGSSSLLSATGALAPSLLRNTSATLGAPASAASSLGGLSNLLGSTVADLGGSSVGGIGFDGGGGNLSQIQQLIRKQQLQELQQLQQLKQREDMQRLSQLQSRDAVLQIMLQQQQQEQQQQALSLAAMNGTSSIAAQLKALQGQQQNNNIHTKTASSITEEAVANFMRKTSQNNKSIANGQQQQNNILQQMQALAKLEQQEKDGMLPPPPMVSAVSSLDSVAIMSMLLPSNQQNQNMTVAGQQQQAPSSNSAASRLLGADLSLTAAGGLGSNLNSSLLSPLPFPSSSLGNLGMAPSAAVSLFGGLSGCGGLSNLLGRSGINALGAAGASSLALHPSAADVIYEQRRLAAAAEVSNTVRDSSVGKPADAFVDRDPDGRARDLPTLLVVPMDHMQLSSHQTLLRYQIEVFRAGEEDTSTHTRGRNKPVQLGQIGIRCRHCKVLPVSRRKRGSVYFPRAVEGFYQAAQNMNSTHLQTGECPLMGNALRQEFANLIATRGVSTGAGRAYWAKQARKLGLRNTENGIVFDMKEPSSGEVEVADVCKKVPD
mmetsp:Transcript_11096/g.26656  ORF Transcript_11096/g.26656 Transcript_11096/m.26656 type:complete len:732 (+) Transcript_11096:98-2293(+)|eukprot:CAMPEP_0197175580 /NCGR_PEP_ID=MMETSP1423-20130617/1763_1 /TAXON_ID=476441 /ORGANISM="Pseudo-nitzschia heimii, Strain UNC1101" /LENGTH=731 /DNA_ID=CAMNT_0042624769 /DNA_START=37 /DNA_END=2232 /DNA_ORIENTATION=+